MVAETNEEQKEDTKSKEAMKGSTTGQKEKEKK